MQTGGQIGNGYFAYGTAPAGQPVTVNFGGRLHRIPVSHCGVWAFIKIRTDPHGHGYPAPSGLTKNTAALRKPERADMCSTEKVIPDHR
jgi:hypothetical protein